MIREALVPPDLLGRWRAGQVDAICPTCQATQAAGFTCYRCGREFSVVDFTLHPGRGRGACLAQHENGPKGDLCVAPAPRGSDASEDSAMDAGEPLWGMPAAA